LRRVKDGLRVDTYSLLNKLKVNMPMACMKNRARKLAKIKTCMIQRYLLLLNDRF